MSWFKTDNATGLRNFGIVIFCKYNITAFSCYRIRPKYSFDHIIYTGDSAYGFGRYIDKSHSAPKSEFYLLGEWCHYDVIRYC